MRWPSSLFVLMVLLGSGCAKKSSPPTGADASAHFVVVLHDAQAIIDDAHAPPVVLPFPYGGDHLHMSIPMSDVVSGATSSADAGSETLDVGPDTANAASVLAPKIKAQSVATLKIVEKTDNLSKEVKAVEALIEEKRRTLPPEAYRQWRASRVKIYLQQQYQQAAPPEPAPVPLTIPLPLPRSQNLPVVPQQQQEQHP